MAQKSKTEKSEADIEIEPEIQTCTSIDSPLHHNEKKFVTSEKTVHLQLETSEIATPVAPAAKISTLSPELESPAHQPASSANRIFTSASMPPPIERKPFWPIALMALVAGSGFYFYQHSTKAENNNRAPASLIVAPAPDSLINTDLSEPSNDHFMELVKSDAIEETSATFVLKSDTDDFRVLVNGKDMPVISGKISLPLNQEFDIRFLRRGHKEIKMVTQTKKPGAQEVALKFEPISAH